MAIQFNQIPGNIRVPFMRIEVNAGRQPYQSIARLLLIGQMSAGGTATADTPVLVTGDEDGLFGHKSMLANMYRTARRNAPLQEIWALPLADNAAATRNVSVCRVLISPTTATNIEFTVDGIPYVVPVAANTPVATIAQRIVDVFSTSNSSRFTASVFGAADVVFTDKLTGVYGLSPNGQPVKSDTITVFAPQSYTVATSAGQRARGVISFTQLPAASGSFVVYVGGQRISVPYNTTYTPEDVAVALAEEINDCPDADVTAYAGAIGTGNAYVNLVSNSFGTQGNAIRIETKMSPDDGDFADDFFTITQPSGGAGDPSISNALSSLGSNEFDWIVMPYAQDAYLDEIEALMDDRWGPMEQTYGHVISAMSVSSAGQAVAFGTLRNSWHSTVFAMQNSPQAPFHLAACLGAICAAHLQDAPELSRPLQTLPMRGIRPPKDVQDWWTTVERQSFYYAGISAAHVTTTGVVQLDRIITTYQRNAWNSRDASWLDINTPAQLMYGLRAMAAGITQTYPRAALMDENPANIQGVATPRDIRNAFIHEYRKLEALGVFENTDLFSKLLVVERNQSDASRLDAFLPLDHVNQLRILAVNATSYLQLDGAIPAA